jgi:hypothetical protein
LGEGLASFTFHFLIVGGGIALAGIGVSRPVMILVAGLTAAAAFLRFAFLSQRGRRGYLFGLLLSAMTYPALYSIVDSSDVGSPDLGLAIDFFRSFAANQVCIPVATLIGSAAVAAGLGAIARDRLILPQRAARQ